MYIADVAKFGRRTRLRIWRHCDLGVRVSPSAQNNKLNKSNIKRYNIGLRN